MASQSDQNYGWNVQRSRPYLAENLEPGANFTAAMLPVEATQEASDIDPDLWLANGAMNILANLTPDDPATTITSVTLGENNSVYVVVTTDGYPPASVTYDWGDGTTGDRLFAPWNAGHKYAAAGIYTISVTAKNNAGTSTATRLYSVNMPKPVLTSGTPLTGVAAGGTTVALTGTGFAAGEAVVKFGTTTGASLVVNSDTTIHVNSPAHAAGTVQISVTTVSGVATNTLSFVYT